LVLKMFEIYPCPSCNKATKIKSDNMGVNLVCPFCKVIFKPLKVSVNSSSFENYPCPSCNKATKIKSDNMGVNLVCPFCKVIFKPLRVSVNSSSIVTRNDEKEDISQAETGSRTKNFIENQFETKSEQSSLTASESDKGKNNVSSAMCSYCGLKQIFEKETGSFGCSGCNRILFGLVNRNKVGEIYPGKINNYKIIELIGEGGMGRVFKGIDVRNGDVVAIKFPTKEFLSLHNDGARFLNEINNLKLLNNQFVVKFLDEGTEGIFTYLVMEYVTGENLESVINSVGSGSALPFNFVLKIFKQLCSALRVMHLLGIVHRDLKPQNLIISLTGDLKLVDLGISKNFSADAQTMAQTSLGGIGTFEYMAPEQFTGLNCNFRCDIYSTGLVFYKALTSFMPRGNVKKPSSLNNTVPKWFDGILLGMMEQDPSERFSIDSIFTIINKNLVEENETNHIEKMVKIISEETFDTAEKSNYFSFKFLKSKYFYLVLGLIAMYFMYDNFYSARAYYNRGHAYAEQKKYDLALSDYNKAIELDPKYVKAYNGRGNAYSDQKKYDLAIADYTQAIELDPKDVKAYNNRGRVYVFQKKYDLAIADFSKVIELDPKFAFATTDVDLHITSKKNMT